jgi:hypothetical protein
MYAARRRPFVLMLGAALLSAAACSDSTGPNGTLTAEETSELALQMGAVFAGGVADPAASVAANGASFSVVPAPFSLAVDFTVPCPRGGNTRLTATVSGTVDEATESINANVEGRHRPANCGIDVHGKTFRTTGDLRTEAHVEAVNGVPVGIQTASLVGDFEWRASDGRRGTCSVNYSASANYTTHVAVVTGNFCGSTISFTGPFTS